MRARAGTEDGSASDEDAGKTGVRALHCELAQMGRLNEIGHMAAALAHELNQPLAAAGNYLAAARQMAGAAGGNTGTVDETLAKAGEQLLRAGEIVRRIRNFVHKTDADHMVIGVEPLVGDAVAMLQLDVSARDVKLTYDLETTPSYVVADKIQLQQVFINLLRNAVEATAGRFQRVITITTHRIDDEVRVSICDNGPGVSDGIARHLFEPFHTSKEAGLGVGLSICRHIIESFGGRIWHREGALGGAEFVFSLPVSSMELKQNR